MPDLPQRRSLVVVRSVFVDSPSSKVMVEGKEVMREMQNEERASIQPRPLIFLAPLSNGKLHCCRHTPVPRTAPAGRSIYCTKKARLRYGVSEIDREHTRSSTTPR